MSRVVVFAGPTVDADTVRRELPEAEVEPPASRGHVYQAALTDPWGIAVIDGLYETVPAIWHKEILFALERGVRVYGSSSMGAIRAAELAPFGMVGVGRIYEQFVHPGLDDDDVAVAHGPATTGFAAISMAMVNIVATLDAARHDGVVSGVDAEAVVAEAKRRFYPERDLAAVVKAVISEPGARQQLLGWLETGVRDQKRDDALLLFDRIRGDLVRHRDRFDAGFRLARTTFFDSLVREIGGHGAGSDLVGWSNPVLEELQLEPDRLHRVVARATRDAYGLHVAELAGLQLDQATVDRVSDSLRFRLGLIEPDDLHRWLGEVDLTFEEYAAMVRRQAGAEVGRAALPSLPQEALLDQLRIEGGYAELRDRSLAKAEALKERGFDEAGHGLDDVDEVIDAALGWFGRERLGRPVAPADVAVVAADLGFRDTSAFVHAVLREHRCTESLDDGAPGGSPADPSFDIAVLGSGMRDHWQLTAEHRALLAQARTVYLPFNASSALIEAISDLTEAELVDRAARAGPGTDRSTLFAEIASEVVERAGRGGGVVVVEYGHPLVYNSQATLILAEAEARGLRTVVAAGISSIDEMLVLFGLDPAVRALHILHTEVVLRDRAHLDPGADVVLMRVGCVARPRFDHGPGLFDDRSRRARHYEDLTAHLLRFYDPGHPALAVEITFEPGEVVKRDRASSITRCTVADLAAIGPDLRTGHSLLIPAIGHAL